MPVVDVKNLQNETVDRIELRDDVFGVELRETLVWEAVRHYMACGRRGTHSTKGRGEVSGSNRKPWRQKGTGRARSGQTRSPIWRHGGTAFGPHPRSYAYAFPKKKKAGAMRSALSEKFRQDQVVVVDVLELSSHKTKEMVGLLRTFGVDHKALFVDVGGNQNAELASRNIPNVKYVTQTGVNIYDVLGCRKVFFSRASILHMQEVLGR